MNELNPQSDPGDEQAQVALKPLGFDAEPTPLPNWDPESKILFPEPAK